MLLDHQKSSLVFQVQGFRLSDDLGSYLVESLLRVDRLNQT